MESKCDCTFSYPMLRNDISEVLLSNSNNAIYLLVQNISHKTEFKLLITVRLYATTIKLSTNYNYNVKL